MERDFYNIFKRVTTFVLLLTKNLHHYTYYINITKNFLQNNIV
ncbi:hypothetical protein AAJ76_3200026422 [Vairimorpha ceranae]|uniref:Uncharacterized protein n=1 Tax=Vairimorpha ceranae TaxID=40302 RepID=A0A0F9WE96_9MICR|nr:hypothetical protein AAJ76_3200026422 [Vairimorpha ceranae]KKO75110.1 hypothetical protein AAJ76_3200026422 [Vairimorpha ceranae]